VVVVAFLGMTNREYVIPAARSHLNYNAQDLGGASGKLMRQRYDNETNICLGGLGSKIFVNEQRIEKPDFYMPRGLDRYGPRISAQNAYYKAPTAERPGGYWFQGMEQPKSLATESSLVLDGKPVLLTPRDYPWLKPNECFVVSNVGFEHLEAGNTWRQLSSTAELIQGLRNRSLDFGADERLAIHARIVQPLLDVTLLFLGLPLVLSRSNRNVFLAIGLCLALVIAFMLVVLGCNFLGSSYLVEPALAAWMPLMIFVPCAMALAQPLWE
jgi:lipopolysaccharide export system permease protein